MKSEIVVRLFKRFEESAHELEGIEYWSARELQELLEYSQWRNFLNVVDKAKESCQTSGVAVSDHFADVSKTIAMPKGAEKTIDDIMLTRYACYLIAQNGDPKKEQIAFAQSYFAIQTRKQEVIEKRIMEWERLQAREKLSASQKELSGLIYKRGVDEKGFGRIISKGDQALFGGKTTADMKVRLDIPDNKPLADFLPTITIKAKDFANEITNFNLKKDDDLIGEDRITNEHVKNNKDVRNLLIRKNIVPERLPKEEDIKKIERKMKSEDKKALKDAKKIKK